MGFSQANKEMVDVLFSEKKNDNQFIKFIMEHLRKTYANEKTRSNKISEFKRYIKKNNMISVENLKLIGDDELRRKLNKEREDRQEPPKQKLNKSVIDKLIEFRDSSNSEKLLIFLLFATGRRITEFIKGNWSVNGGKLFIDKISKKREGNITPQQGFEIKLIDKIKPTEFMTLLNKFKRNNNRSSTEASRKAVNRILKKPEFAPISKVKDLRPLYVQYLKNYDEDIKKQNGNQAIKNVLHHNKKSTSILYNDKFDIIKVVSDTDLKKMKRSELKALLIKNNINKNNTKRFNVLKKSELIALVKKK